MEVENIPEEPELPIREIEQKYDLEPDMEIPESFPYYSNMIPWFFIENRSWPRAAMKAGFDPEDKITQRLAAKHLAQYEKYWTVTANEALLLGKLSYNYDPVAMSEAINNTLLEYTYLLKRPRRMLRGSPKQVAFSNSQIQLDKECIGVLKLLMELQKEQRLANEKDITPKLKFGG